MEEMRLDAEPKLLRQMGCEPLTLVASKVDLLGLLVAVGDRDAIAMAGFGLCSFR